MDINNLKYKAKILFHKYKYAVLVVMIGICLMLIPSKSSGKDVTEQRVSDMKEADTVQQELESILSGVQGVGKIKVMLKESQGSETVFETNQTSSHSENSSELKTEIITITDSDRNENGLIKQINPPRYQGAIIICQGANDPKVRLAVTDAVSKITGLGADRIAVLIMK